MRRDLFASTRPNDLPPLWDGQDVEWEDWRDPGQVFICPPPTEPGTCCPACGSIVRPVLNIGRTWLVLTDIFGRESRQRKVLSAFRCVDCGHDQVRDGSDGQWYNLDPDDYLDEGSFA